MSESCLAVAGDLTLDTVAGLYQESLVLAKEEKLPDIIDLKGIHEIDSSGLALLLEWQSWALAHDHRFEFRNTPRHLMQLAELSETQCLLDLQYCEEQAS